MIAAMLDAIDRVIDREQITLTEAVRRLIGYGDFVYQATKVDGCDVLIQEEGGRMSRVTLL